MELSSSCTGLQLLWSTNNRMRRSSKYCRNRRRRQASVVERMLRIRCGGLLATFWVCTAVTRRRKASETAFLELVTDTSRAQDSTSSKASETGEKARECVEEGKNAGRPCPSAADFSIKTLEGGREANPYYKDNESLAKAIDGETQEQCKQRGLWSTWTDSTCRALRRRSSSSQTSPADSVQILKNAAKAFIKVMTVSDGDLPVAEVPYSINSDPLEDGREWERKENKGKPFSSNQRRRLEELREEYLATYTQIANEGRSDLSILGALNHSFRGIAQSIYQSQFASEARAMPLLLEAFQRIYAEKVARAIASGPIIDTGELDQQLRRPLVQKLRCSTDSMVAKCVEQAEARGRPGYQNKKLDGPCGTSSLIATVNLICSLNLGLDEKCQENVVGALDRFWRSVM
ncbi:unnamed protein product [Amoebophrya sp. A25]|nr:unnamed protein product [Amoebophrya sp. A25]|eukprot:GSA25T00016416001.1